MRRKTSKWNRQLLAGMLAFLMVVSLVPMPAYAAEVESVPQEIGTGVEPISTEGTSEAGIQETVMESRETAPEPQAGGETVAPEGGDAAIPAEGEKAGFNGYLTDVQIYLDMNKDRTYLQGLEFETGTEEYEIAIPENWTMAVMAFKLKTERPENLYAKLEKAGTAKPLKEQKLSGENPAISFLANGIQIGVKSDLILTVGVKDSAGKYSNPDVYTFHAIRKLCPNYVPAVELEDGTKLQVLPEKSASGHAVYEKEFTCTVPAGTKKIKLNFCPPKATYDKGLVKAYIDGKVIFDGQKKYENKYEWDLGDYSTDPGSRVKIPLELEYIGQPGTGEGSVYHLVLDFQEVYPVITKQPGKEVTCKKGDDMIISVEAESPNQGELAYQWYEDDKKIESATESSYKVPTEYGSIRRYHCVVTNTKDGVSYQLASTVSKVTVQTTTIEKPEVTKAEASATEYYEGTVPGTVRGPVPIILF